MPLIKAVLEQLDSNITDVRDATTDIDLTVVVSWLGTRKLWNKPLSDWDEQEIRDFVSACGLAIMWGQGDTV